MSETVPTLRADARRTRDALLRAAEAVLAEDPGASVDKIAATAGVARATAFRHFPSRDALVVAAWQAAAASAAGELDEAALESIGATDVPLELLAATIRVAERHPLLVHGPRPATADVTKAFATTDERLRAAVARAQRAGAARDDLPPEVLVEHLLSTAQSVLLCGLVGDVAVRVAQALALDGVKPG